VLALVLAFAAGLARYPEPATPSWSWDAWLLEVRATYQIKAVLAEVQLDRIPKRGCHDEEERRRTRVKLEELRRQKRELEARLRAARSRPGWSCRLPRVRADRVLRACANDVLCRGSR
jgi:hypothetical protein